MFNPKKNSAPADLVKTGTDTIIQEIMGLQSLAESLDQHFVAAVETIFNLRGRLIVSGMGKSGHIARKIAATLSSTGTAAYFVHPAEASHGDLGMITREDGLLLLSNSGETLELRDMISYAKRFAIPLIGVVRRPTSMLVEASDIALVLPEIAEASPVGAPTTSTIMMLALGDALAMALLKMRGFTIEDFQTYHPGGKLGQRFLRVRDIMHGVEELPVVQEETPMQEVLLVMTARRFGCAGVLNHQGQLCGVITDGDLRRHMDNALLYQTAAEVMTANPLFIRSNALAAEALQTMNDRAVTTLFVCENQCPVGILHIHDCLRAGIM
jgi:arabinose-5-phosphate isomerase